MPHFHAEPRVALAVYRRLLRLYPRSLRRELGAEMEGLFLDLHADARELGRLHAAWLVLRAWGEVLPRAAQAHGDPDSPTGAYLVRSFFSDLRFAWLAATRQRRHTAIVVATMAIGIGATTAVFSVTDAAILRKLPFPEGHRLVTVAQSHPAGWLLYSLDSAAFQAWSEQEQLFDAMGGYTTEQVGIQIDGEPREFDVVQISPNLLTLLGARPVAGRLLAAEDAAEGAAPTVLISERMWRREFAADADLSGEWLSLEGIEHEIVGVIPDTFAFPSRRTDFWTAVDPAAASGFIRPLARLAPDLTLDRATEMATSVAEGLAEAQPREGGWSIGLIPMDTERTNPNTRTALWVGLGAAALLLLVAIVNVAQVALARAVEREGELVMRAALGAGRGRIVRQVLMESLLLSLGGGMVGALLAYFLVGAISAAAPPDMVRVDAIQLGVEWRALGAAILLSVVVGLLAGALPAWSAARRCSAAAMKKQQRGMSSSRSRRRVQSSLIVAEAALCMVLLADAGLLLKSFDELTQVDPGFDPEPLVSLILRFDETRYPTPESRLTFFETLQDRVSRLPGVEQATIGGDAAPQPGGTMLLDSVEVEGGEAIEESVVLPYGRVSSGYFTTTGIDLLEGRALDESDYDTDNVVISAPLARRLFGESSAVGRRFRWDSTGDWITVIGVVRETATFSLQSSEDDYQAYFPLKSERTPRPYGALIVRASADPSLLQTQLERTVWDIDPRQPISRFELGSETMAEWIVDTRFNAMVFGTFAVVALLLVLVGVAGVVGHAVASRTREIGIRVALGAGSGSILRLATFGGLRPVLVGLALGALIAWQTSSLISSLLFGVEPNDPATLGAVALVFSGGYDPCFVHPCSPRAARRPDAGTPNGLAEWRNKQTIPNRFCRSTRWTFRCSWCFSKARVTATAS